MRYIDDIVVCFPFREDALRFQDVRAAEGAQVRRALLAQDAL